MSCGGSTPKSTGAAVLLAVLSTLLIAGPMSTPRPAAGSGSSTPSGDVVLVEGVWRPLELSSHATAGLAELGRPGHRRHRQLALRLPGGRHPRITDAAIGDVTGDGRDDLVVAFRRQFQRTLINSTRPRSAWVDRTGRSAHVAVYRPDDLRETWVAGTLVMPVVELAACDGAVAVAYGWLRRPGVRQTGAWRWQGFGFLPVESLPGPGRPTCVDIDGDGRTEPAIRRGRPS